MTSSNGGFTNVVANGGGSPVRLRRWRHLFGRWSSTATPPASLGWRHLGDLAKERGISWITEGLFPDDMPLWKFAALVPTDLDRVTEDPVVKQRLLDAVSFVRNLLEK
ncbi:unnamed protein product, partial [Cyprideis torosa]